MLSATWTLLLGQDSSTTAERRETHTAWNPPHLRGPEPLTPHRRGLRRRRHHAAEELREALDRRRRTSPPTWPGPRPSAFSGTAQLLLVVEDIDVPLAKPAVHCLAPDRPGRPDTWTPAPCPR
ncbi:hypothetical protein ACRAWF_16285 [Streptomyces sp. L7]